MDEDLFEERLEALLDKVRDDIDRVGWSGIGVFPDEPGGTQYTYTVGLTEVEHPELIMYGLDNVLTHHLLWSAFDLIKEGERFTDESKRYSGVLEGFDVMVRAVEQP